jgi:Zn-dependent protease
MEPLYIVTIFILILSIIAHEVAHGFVAHFFGDPTAKIAGRLTANPLKHFDFIGSFIVPALFFLTSGGVAGWAKPVPYNPYMLRGRFAEVAVAAAGVSMNIILACMAALVLHGIGYETQGMQGYITVLVMIIHINIGLAIFNLLPFPPFDGLRIITSIAQGFGVSRSRFAFVENPMWTIVSLIIAFNVWPIIAPIVKVLTSILIY